MTYAPVGSEEKKKVERQSEKEEEPGTLDTTTGIVVSVILLSIGASALFAWFWRKKRVHAEKIVEHSEEGKQVLKKVVLPFHIVLQKDQTLQVNMPIIMF